MKKKLIIVVIICLMLFLFRNYIIKYYFISKIEYVDYDEYILIDYLNGKKNKATYVGADSMVVLDYNSEDGEVEIVVVYDYSKKTKYQRNLKTNDLDKNSNNEDRPINLNNEYLLELLKSKAKFKYKGIKIINDRECYVLEFRTTKGTIVTVYLDKEFLYTLKYVERFTKDSNKESYLINNYEIDLKLENKDLFKEYVN